MLLKNSRVNPLANNNECLVWAAKRGHLRVVQHFLRGHCVHPDVGEISSFKWGVMYVAGRSIETDAKITQKSPRGRELVDDILCRAAITGTADSVETVPDELRGYPFMRHSIKKASALEHMVVDLLRDAKRRGWSWHSL
jgi:hypothetical protein